MDANTHNPMWGPADSNARGEMIEEFVLHHDLLICNKGSLPTFVGRNTSTIIDITLCTRNLLHPLETAQFVADAIEYIYSAIELQCSEGARDRLSGCSVA